MTQTLLAGIRTLKTHPTHDGVSWHDQCASAMCCAVSGIGADGHGIGDSRPTARQALAASGPLLSTDGNEAIPGVFGWWSDGATGDGHVAAYVGRGLWMMASNAVEDGGTEWGHGSCVGTITLARYAAVKPAMRWVGFTADYCGQLFAEKQLLFKVAGRPEIWRIQNASTVRHILPAEYRGLKSAGVPVLTVPARTLARFGQVAS